MVYDKRVRTIGETTLRQAQLVMLEMMKVVDGICRRHDIQYWLDAGTLLGAVRHKGFIPWDDDLDIIMPREDFDRFIEIASQELPEDLFLQTRKTDKSIWKWIKIRDNYSTFIQKTEKDKKIEYHQGIFMDIFPYDIVEKKYNLSKMFLNRRFQVSDKTRKFAWILNPLSTLMVKLIGFERLKKYFIKKHSGNNPRYVAAGIEFTLAFHSFEYDLIFPLKEINFEGYSFLAPSNPDKYLTTIFGDYMKLPEEQDRKAHAYKILPFEKCNHEMSLQY